MNRIYIDQNQKFYLRLYISKASHIFTGKKILEQEVVANAEKFYFLSLFSTNIPILNIGDEDFEIYFLDKKFAYIVLNKFIKTKVLAA